MKHSHKNSKNGLGRAQRATVLALLLSAFSPAFAGTTTWIGPANGDWGNDANWAPATYPNVADEIARFTNNFNGFKVAFSNGIEQVTFGSLIASNAFSTGGGLVIGDPNQPGVALTAQTTSGKPVFYVGTNSGHTVFMYAQSFLTTQGFTKTGPGKFTFRFNGNPQSYTGNIDIVGGILGINDNYSLGDDNNDISISNGARLAYEPGANSGTTTLPATRSINLLGAQSQIGVSGTSLNGTELIVEGSVTGIGTAGLVKTDNGKLTLNGSVEYYGDTRVVGGTVVFNPPSGNFVQGGELLLQTPTGGALDFSALSTFTATNATKQFRVIPNTSSGVGVVNDLYMAKSGPNGGRNVITAQFLQVGGGSASQGLSHIAQMHLGTTNIWNLATSGADSIFIGGWRAAGLVDFQGGLTSPSLKIRAADGVSRLAGNFRVGLTASGSISGAGTLNLGGGTFDALVTEMTVSYHNANASNNDSSSVTMDDGTLDAVRIVLAEKVNGGATNAPNPTTWPTLTGTINQNGGTVRIQSLLMGRESTGIQYPVLKPTYNLANGTLAAATITNGPGAFNSDPGTSRNINWTGGTIRNYDGATDLTIDTPVSAYPGLEERVLININVGSPVTFYADAGRKITLGIGSRLNDMFGGYDITNAGPGTLVINSVNPYTGTLRVDAGALAGSGSVAGPVVIASGATLAPGASVGVLTINNELTLEGTTIMELDRAAAPANSDRIAGLTKVNYGGALIVTNIGAALQVGDEFTLFAAGDYGTTSFASVQLPAGYGWLNTLSTDGKIKVTSVPVTQPTLVYERDGGNFVFTWTGSGFKLQAQTNSTSIGLSNNWADVPGGGTSGVSVPVDANNGAVFFRLISTP